MYSPHNNQEYSYKHDDSEDDTDAWRKRIYEQMGNVMWDIAEDHQQYKARGKSSSNVKDTGVNQHDNQIPNLLNRGSSKTYDKTIASNALQSSDKKDNSNSNYEAIQGAKGNEFKSYKGSSSNSQMGVQNNIYRGRNSNVMMQRPLKMQTQFDRN